MKTLSLWTALLTLIVGSSPVWAEPKPREVDPAECVIVVSAKSNDLVDYAAAELVKHLALITGRTIPTADRAEPGRFPIYLGVRPADDTRTFAAEEARWRVTPHGVWLYGDDQIVNRGRSAMETAVSFDNHAGTLFAAYEFLEDYFGVRWIEPGDSGIAFHRSDLLRLPEGRGDWIPELQQRLMRSAYRDADDPDGIDLRQMDLATGNVPARFIYSTDEFARRRDDEAVWKRRMRMGRSIPAFRYGHAFTHWWYEYGQTHPEFFALNKDGKREPYSGIMQGAPERIKMCVSNADLVREIVRRHFATEKGSIVDACENDSRGYCRCDSCQAWDVRLPGEEQVDVDQLPMTDRYVRFVDAVETEAKKHDPAARTVFYAYSQYRLPPRSARVSDGVIVFFINGMFAENDATAAFYDGWKKAGVNSIYLRPNDLCQDTGLPLGFEQKMFEKLQTARSHFKLIGTDYDTCWGYWPVSGITNYIMARAFYRPDRPFAYWENEYCEGFGAAHDEIRDYYRYWRGIWNDRILPNRDRIVRITGTAKEVNEKLQQVTDLLYSEGDFDRTDALLGAALRRDLPSNVRARVGSLQLANRHSRLKYRAMTASELFSRASPAERKAANEALMDFRREHRKDLNINWESMFHLENTYEDVCGTLRLAGAQGKRFADWSEQMADSIRRARGADEAPLR